VYSAPEVYIQEIYERNEGDYNEKCDVFSAGYILYEMLTSEALNKGVKTAADLHKFLMNNKKKGGFEINDQALTARWI
jgi:serine/threonine protein kinase